MVNKRSLSESDICDRYISPALISSGWDETRWRREYPFTAGRIVVRGELVARGKQKRLPTDFFASFPFPLPPLLEQERIVERTRSLMRMCDELERNIISSAFIANQLARSVVSASS